MIYVDGATGSGDLVLPLRRLGLPAEKKHLTSGDVAFTGRGVGGSPLSIGIEIKTIGELVTSLQTERLTGHQLLEMTQMYDRRYLIIEGDFNHDSSGRGTRFRSDRRGSKKIEPMRGVPNAIDLEKRLLNLQTRGGLITRHVDTRRDTLRVIQAWYYYWTDSDLDDHRSHLAIYAPDLDPALNTPISDFRRMVAQIPGIGYTTSAAVDAYFNSDADAMMSASEDEWAEVMTVDEKTGKTRRLGATKAAKVWTFLHPSRR